ncbi:MAG: MarR family transcriptional regulator [Hyphomicrobiales bacterium]|nr:MarR family transcriptional regulator [Hyphomicrobiales bacterium]
MKKIPSGTATGAQSSPTVTTEDYETRGAHIDHQDLRLWLRMMALQKLIVNELRRRLRASFTISLSRFDFMSQLDSTKTGMRMGELSGRLMVTTGNITGLTDELEIDGLIERMADPTSRRASLVRLTAKGRKQFRTAAKAHEAWITEFFSVLSQEDKKTLLDLLGLQKAFVVACTRSATKGKTAIEKRASRTARQTSSRRTKGRP